MTLDSPWFVQERAEYFSSRLLTKHNDVKVRPYSDDAAIHLLVEALKRGKATLRFFGVRVIGCTEPLAAQDLDGLIPSQRGNGPQEAVLPICVFVIGVDEPKGLFCRWVAEPVVDNGQAVLIPAKGTEWQPLDDSTVVRLIRQVVAWYEARNGSRTLNGSLEGATRRSNKPLPGAITEG